MFRNARLFRDLATAAGGGGAGYLSSHLDTARYNELRSIYVPTMPLELSEQFPAGDRARCGDCANTSEAVESYLQYRAQPHETDAAIECIVSRPELVSRILPLGFPEISNKAMNEIVSNVRNVMNNPDLIRATCQRIQENQLQSLPAPIAPQDDEEDEPSTPTEVVVQRTPNHERPIYMAPPKIAALRNEAWESLSEQYSCAVCQDVLAAPIIIDCSHTFCGSCLQDQMDQCVSSDVEVSHSCCLCREAITHVTFVRLLDDMISKLVENIPNCNEKTEWIERRQKYFNRLMKENSGKGAGKSKGRTASSRRRRGGGGHGNGTAGIAEEDEDAYIETIVQYAVPFLVVAVVTLLVLCRQGQR